MIGHEIDPPQRIRVVAAVLEAGPGAPTIPGAWLARGKAAIAGPGRWLLARKAPGKKLEGCWELPGGKIEADETAGEALVREIREELGLETIPGAWVATNEHVYPHITVILEAWRATIVGGNWQLVDHDLLAWVDATTVGDFDAAPADIPLLTALAAG